MARWEEVETELLVTEVDELVAMEVEVTSVVVDLLVVVASLVVDLLVVVTSVVVDLLVVVGFEVVVDSVVE